MKVLTLWQPWAMLIAVGMKWWETRSWATNYRGPLLIHAAKRPLDRHGEEICARAGLHTDMPFGAILCEVELIGCTPTTLIQIIPGSNEMWGDFTPGRFGWRLEYRRRFFEPIPCVGRQRLFNPSPEVLARVRGQQEVSNADGGLHSA